MSYNDKEDSYDDIDNTMRKDHTNKSKKKEKNQNITLGYEKEEDEKKKKEKKNENILDEIKAEEKKDEDKEELNNSRDYKDEEGEEDNNEPNFYGSDNDNDNYYESSSSDHEKNIKKKKQDELKKQNININNIYDINNKFNYNKNNPVFYILEDKKPPDTYPSPLSTNKLIKLIKDKNISYESLKVRLVDLFKFKSKAPSTFVDFIEVLKPNWASDVETFLNLVNNNNENDTANKNKKIKNIKKNINDLFNANISDIKGNKNVQEPFSFSSFDKEKEDKKMIEDKKENKDNNNGKKNKNKKKGKKKCEDLDIKTRFIYDD